MIRVLAVGLFVVGCMQAPREVTAEKESALQSVSTGDAVTNAGTCHIANTCPDRYFDCRDWSTPAYCDDTCTKPCCHDAACNEPDMSGIVYKEQSRTCYSEEGNTCIQWRIQSAFVCGC